MVGTGLAAGVAQFGGDVVPRGSRTNVFDTIFTAFLVLGTLVGIVVLGYMCYKAYKYRDGGGHAAEGDGDRPELGELPEGGGKGRKLFLSFGLSAVVVISLIIWTYGTLLYVEGDACQDAEQRMDVQVTGYQFGWEFQYPNGHTTRNELRVPEDTCVTLEVTSRDVFHNFGVPALRAKSDAIPGETTETWFNESDPGTYRAACYELCGDGHSYMTASVHVMDQGAFQQWYANTTDGTAATTGS